MASTACSDAVVVHLFAFLRGEPTGVNDPHNADIIRIIVKVNEKQFRPMF
jgi:hypothetical protein